MKQLPDAFVARMKQLLGEDYTAFATALDQPAERAFRVNTDKISLADFTSVNTLDTQPIPYVPTGYYFRGEKIGHHPFHHAGMIYAQDPGAMATAECLDIDPDWWVLDLCAAPGGKTSQLKNKLGQNGLLIANEIIPSRCKILTGNVERLGLTHMATTCLDPARVASLFSQTFDLVVVDAPCSGEGMFRKDDTAIAEWSEENVMRCAARQKEILDHAVSTLRPGGYLIYATCTFSLEENEMVVDYLLSKYSYFSLVSVNDAVRAHTDDGITFDGCHCQNLQDARRFYPHKSRGEGQFMAVLHDARPSLPRPISARPAIKPDPIVVNFLQDTLTDYDPVLLTVYNGKPVYAPPALSMRDGAFSYGITVGEVKKNYLLPHHQFFMAMGKHFKRKIELAPDDPRLEQYLHGEEILADCENGWAAVTTLGCPIGGAKVSSGHAKNHYPKGLRLL